MKVLVTGFEPFGGDAVNASWEAVRLLPALVGGELELVALELPVEFGRAARIAADAVARELPDAVVCTGVAAGRARVTPELVGINHRCARIPDNAGAQPRREPVVPGGPDAYFSTLPVYEMAEAACAAGVPAAVSYSAGTYCCNDLLYAMCHLAACEYPSMRVGFVHVPATPAQVASAGGERPSMPSDMVAAALAAMLRVL